MTSLVAIAVVLGIAGASFSELVHVSKKENHA